MLDSCKAAYGSLELEHNCSKQLIADVSLCRMRGAVSQITCHFLVWCTSVAFKFKGINNFSFTAFNVASTVISVPVHLSCVKHSGVKAHVPPGCPFTPLPKRYSHNE